MDLITIFLIACGLAADSFAVAVTSGFAIKDMKVKNVLKIAFFLSFFQAMMPVLGWLAGLSMRNYIQEIDHWIAFTLLSLLGLKMIYEGIFRKKDSKIFNPVNTFVLLYLSMATSIDALVVGISFAFIDISIITPVLIIGIVTFLFSISGIYIGKNFGKLFSNKIEILGGMILIGIGTKILIEHLYY